MNYPFKAGWILILFYYSSAGKQSSESDSNISSVCAVNIIAVVWTNHNTFKSDFCLSAWQIHVTTHINAHAFLLECLDLPVFCRFVWPCQILLPPIKTVGSTIICITVILCYSWLWLKGIQLRSETTIHKYFYLVDCVLLKTTPTPTPNLPLIVMHIQ